MTYMDYSSAERHVIAESGFDQRYAGKCESVMSQGNGYLGLRAAAEEAYPNTCRGLFVAGTFDRFDEEEVSELPNAADCTEMALDLNGHLFSLDRGMTLEYHRELDLRTGLLTRRVRWRAPDGLVWNLDFERFVSLNRLHLYAQRLRLTLEDGETAPVAIRSGINGRVTNSGTQHFSDGEKRYYGGAVLQLVQTTAQSGIHFVHNARHIADTEMRRSLRMPRRGIEEVLSTGLTRGKTLEVVKFCNVYTTRDLDSPPLEELMALSRQELDKACGVGFDALMAESARAWKEQVWDAAPIRIESRDPLDQLAIDFAQYHLRIMVPRHDSRMNIGAKGLSGEGYKGHCFWDTEIFLLPYYSFHDPDAARKLVEYRYLALPAARNKARENGFAGAMYPWESAWYEDGDVTPLWAGADVVTGKRGKVWSGLIEQHITADVAYGVWQYYLTTGDRQFMEQSGYEMILDTACFWSSRLEWSDLDGRYHINDVIGADEYKEHCNDNSLTNYLAKWNMALALNCCATLRSEYPDLYARFQRQIELDLYIKRWEEQIPLIFLNRPRADGVIGQDRDYLSYPEIDLKKYKAQTHVDTILEDYNQAQLSKLQVTKQADLLMLMFMLDDLFSSEIKMANVRYYEPKTTHDSSLSYCTHSVMASDVSDGRYAYELYRKARDIDIGENMTSSDAGIHTASIGGIWQCVVLGFGGVRLSGSGLRIDPRLPECWNSLRFVLRYLGETLSVAIERKGADVQTTVTNLSKHKKVMVCVQGEIQSV